MLCTRRTLPIKHARLVQFLLWLDPWQLSLKYSNSATELVNDLTVQLAGHLPGHGFDSLTESLSLFSFFLISISTFPSLRLWPRLRSDCQLWSMFITEPAPPTNIHVGIAKPCETWVKRMLYSLSWKFVTRFLVLTWLRGVRATDVVCKG